MNATIMASELRGTVRAISSKSQVHRMLIGAALADQPVWLNCRGLSNDVIATMNCLKSLGANVVYTYRLAPSLEKEVFDSIYGHTVRLVNEEDVLCVTPLTGVPKKAVLDPGESGSTYRFFTPLVAALGVETHFNLHGKLPPWRDNFRQGYRPSRSDGAAHIRRVSAARLCVVAVFYWIALCVAAAEWRQPHRDRRKARICRLY